MKRRIVLLFFVLFTSVLAPGVACAQRTPFLLWPTPDPIPFSTPLSPVQQNATALAGPPVPVPLAAAYNVLGITTAGTFYYTGGYDGSSWTFSSELLGTSVPWQGIPFPIGPANAPDATYGTTVAVPAGQFSSLRLLGSLVNNALPPTAHIVLTYTDGSTAAVDQNMSDWVNPRNYPGESIVRCMPSRHGYLGTTDLNSVCLYGYSLPVDPTRTLASFTLPATRNVVFVSAVLVPPVVQGSYTYTPTAWSAPASGITALTTVFTPATPALFTSATADNTLVVAPPAPLVVPRISWPVPAPVLPGDNLSAAQLDASASAAFGPVLVPLGASYRVNALYPDGAQYMERGFDGSSTAFSSTALGASLRFAGAVFPLGPPSLPDAATASTIPLPPGSYTTLYLLGAAGSAAELAQPFTVEYTDGTSSTALLNLSSWRSPQNFAGETLVASTPYANRSDGTELPGSFSVYGYLLPVDPTRTPLSLVLPPSTDVLLLAAGLDTGRSFPVAGSFQYTPPAGTVIQSYTMLSTSFSPADTTDFLPATASVPLVVGDLDFVLAAPQGSTLSLTTGGQGTLSFTISPTNGRFGGPLTATLEGALPPLASYTLTPISSSSTAGPSTLTLAIQTRLLAGSLLPRSPSGAGLAVKGGAALCLLLFVPWLPRRRRRLPAALLLLVFAMLLPTGCGSGYADRGYPLLLVVTDGHFTHSLPVTLHIVASAQ